MRYLRSRRVPALALLGASAALALSGFVLLAKHGLRASPATTASGVVAAAAQQSAPRASASFICSLSNADAAAAQIQGTDGGESVVTGGRSYWLFGDTLLLPQSGRQIQANAIAWSQGTGAAGCPALHYSTADTPAGPSAAAFIEKDGSLTVWPSGAIVDEPAGLDVFTTYVYGSGPYAYWIGEVGIARLDISTMKATVVNRRLFDAHTGFESQVVGVQPVDADGAGRERLILTTVSGDHMLARVPLQGVADAASYEYWDGRAWSRDAAAATPLWPHAEPGDPVQRLAAFESGASIAYNAYLHEYVALVNVGFDKIGARVAKDVEGPWSAPAVWIDCSTVAQPAVPVCYSPEQHAELAGEGGRSLLVTFTRMGQYDTVAYRVRLDAPAQEVSR